MKAKKRILATLLILSFIALAGIFLYRKFFPYKLATVTVSDNLITPDSSEEGNAAERVQVSQKTDKTATIRLYEKHPEDNTPFFVGNMFPGDSVTKNFCVRISYHGSVTIYYSANLNSDNVKLAEALNIKIKMLPDNTILYDGCMKNMPTDISYQLESEKSTTTKLNYEITVYLPEETGNDYQNQTLTADFVWWTDDAKNLEPTPKTGDNTSLILLGSLMLCTGCVLLFLRKKRKEERNNEKQ